MKNDKNQITVQEQFLLDVVEYRVSKSKGKVKSLGFVFDEEEERRYREALRSSILFMQGYGKDAKGSRNDDGLLWLGITEASIYCDLPERYIVKASEAGLMRRRLVRDSIIKGHYEYCVSDLEQELIK